MPWPLNGFLNGGLLRSRSSPDLPLIQLVSVLKTLREIAVVFLALFAGFGFGVLIMRVQVWPYPHVVKLVAFFEGHPEETVGLVEKILNDIDFKPYRQIVVHPRDGNRTYQTVDLPEANERRDAPLLYLSPRAERGYRVIFGPMDFADHLHGAILLDSGGKIIHRWVATEEQLTWEHRPDTNTFPHGLNVRPDGSILVSFDGGASIQRIDVCGRVLWATEGHYNHTIEPEGTTHVWTLRGNNLQKIDVETGKLARGVSLVDIWRANPDIDILGLRQLDRAGTFEWLYDPLHSNDVEPLPADLAANFPQFAVGDLLVSLRSLNLLFVVDPESLRVKWWRIGPWRRQHDPDWQPDGRISVYDNNMHRQSSRIVAISPQTLDMEIIADGEAIGFYSWNRGKHQAMPGGHLLITIPGQGRVIELDRNGEIVMEFVNLYDQNTNENLIVSEGLYLPEDFFEFEEFPACDRI